jgi:hypothetical protein
MTPLRGAYDMHIEFLVEESSAEVVLQNMVPRILDAGVTYSIHPHQGKPDLLKKLPDRLRGYSRWIPDDWRIVVLLDADEVDCHNLKAKLEDIASDAGLTSKSAVAPGSRFQVLNRLAVKELEAWFFGDVAAIHTAFPRIPLTLGSKARYRNPDAIPGKTREVLQKMLQKHGYSVGMSPIAVSRAISRYMDPRSNRSKSFQVFATGLQKM